MIMVELLLSLIEDEEEPLADEPEEECIHCGWKESQCICDAAGGDEVGGGE